MTYDIIGLGCATVDDLLYVDSYPPPDVKNRILRSERQCGGLTATALVAAARFGAKCAYAGQLGTDDLSTFVDTALRAERIDTLVHVDGATPIHSTIIVDTGHHTRNIFFEIAGAVGAHDELPDENVIRNARILFVDHYGIPGNLRAIAIAHAAGIPVVADLERDNVDGFYDMLPLIGHLIVSARFARNLTGKTDPAEAALALLSRNVPCSGSEKHGDAGIPDVREEAVQYRQVAVVTDGPRGAWYSSLNSTFHIPHSTFPGPGKASVHHQPAFPVDIVDTTGCGDVFHGVYAAALAEGLPIDARIRLASAASALKAGRPGAQRGIPTRAEIEAFLVLQTR